MGDVNVKCLKCDVGTELTLRSTTLKRSSETFVGAAPPHAKLK